MKDIRDKSIVRHVDVVALNFIRDTGKFAFRHHHLNGLRSHIMEMLAVEDIKKESRGVYVNGFRRFPIARPLRILRIFRKRFSGYEEIFEEVRRFQIVEHYLTATHLAMSEEFIVDYFLCEKRDLLLCGLQEYIGGECLDLWTAGNVDCLNHIAKKLADKAGVEGAAVIDKLRQNIEKSAGSFVGAIKKMIREANYIPDLAGRGNILVTFEGHLKLVDINNISYITSNGCVLVDEFNYPVCDKSIEVLLLIERKLLKRSVEENDPFYKHYLHPERLRQVETLTRRFHETILEFPGTKNI